MNNSILVLSSLALLSFVKNQYHGSFDKKNYLYKFCVFLGDYEDEEVQVHQIRELVYPIELSFLHNEKRYTFSVVHLSIKKDNLGFWHAFIEMHAKEQVIFSMSYCYESFEKKLIQSFSSLIMHYFEFGFGPVISNTEKKNKLITLIDAVKKVGMTVIVHPINSAFRLYTNENNPKDNTLYVFELPDKTFSRTVALSDLRLEPYNLAEDSVLLSKISQIQKGYTDNDQCFIVIHPYKESKKIKLRSR